MMPLLGDEIAFQPVGDLRIKYCRRVAKSRLKLFGRDPVGHSQAEKHELASRFRELGFKYVTLDLHGFRSGAMNEVLSPRS